jgi:hypothetical protein
MPHLHMRFQPLTPKSDSTNLSVIYTVCIYPNTGIDHFNLVEVFKTSQASCIGSRS